MSSSALTTMFPTGGEDHYWNLKLKDGRVIEVPPQAVQHVKAKMNNRSPVHTSQESIPYAEIVGFEKSSKRLGHKQERQLMVEAAQAFNEPIITKSGGVAARWVKKEVAKSEYDRKYAKNSHYKYLKTEDGMVTVAFVLPIHRFDDTYMEYCTPEEERALENLTI